MNWPLKNVYITQSWGANPDIYKRFGLLGHDGIDLRAPIGTDVLAPHAGVIKERAFDADGYGNYVKIENDKEGSVLGHLNDFTVTLGQTVNEGDLIGHADNTGFSTASHLHWGYYQIPRNRNDGYLGFINQEPLLKESMPDDALQACLKDREKFWKERDELLTALNASDIEGGKSTIAGYKSRITDLTNQLGTAQGEIKNKTEEVSRLNNEVLKLNDDKRILENQVINKQIEINQLAGEKGNLVIENEQLKVQIETLKQQQQQGEVTITVREFISLLLKQKITIKK